MARSPPTTARTGACTCACSPACCRWPRRVTSIRRAVPCASSCGAISCRRRACVGGCCAATVCRQSMRRSRHRDASGESLHTVDANTAAFELGPVPPGAYTVRVLLDGLEQRDQDAGTARDLGSGRPAAGGALRGGDHGPATPQRGRGARPRDAFGGTAAFRSGWGAASAAGRRADARPCAATIRRRRPCAAGGRVLTCWRAARR